MVKLKMTKLYHELIFLSTHRTKYEESGNLNIAETRGTITETRRLTRVSVSGYITLRFLMFPSLHFQRNRNTFFHVSDRFPFQESHISAIFIMWISCGNAKLHSETSLFHFLHSAETWSYGAATCFFFSVSIRFRCINYVNVSKALFAHADANFSCR